jgi:hypothetical protein
MVLLKVDMAIYTGSCGAAAYLLLQEGVQTKGQRGYGNNNRAGDGELWCREKNAMVVGLESADAS